MMTYRATKQVMQLLRTALLMIALARPAVGQTGTVSLLVIDDTTDAPLSDVRVAVAGRAEEGLTDARGRILLAARQGRTFVVLRRLGYSPGTLQVDVVSGDTTRVTYGMSRIAVALPTVAVTDTLTSLSPFLRGFERRASIHAGTATYITRAEIERRKPIAVLDLLRPVSALKFVGGVAASRRLDAAGMGGRSTKGQSLSYCPLAVVVDGQLKETGFQVNDLVPQEIHGIEVYPGPATVPAEYASLSSNSACGVILIWTRRHK